MKVVSVFIAALAFIIGLIWYKFYLTLSPKLYEKNSAVVTVSHNLINVVGQFIEDLGLASRASVLRFFTALKMPSALSDFERDILIEDAVISGIPVRIYRPKAKGAETGITKTHPGVIYIHGGGLVFLSARNVAIDRLCAHTSNVTNAIVISVEYRLSPEHLFPAHFDDTYAVISTLIGDPGMYGITKGKLVIMGDSAGGLLTAAVNYQLIKEQKFNDVAAQILIYPWLQLIDQTYLPSYQQFSDGFLLSRDHITYFALMAATGTQKLKEDYMSGNISRYFMCTQYWKYLELPVSTNCEDTIKNLPLEFVQAVTDPRLSPLLVENLENLPPTLVVTADYDILCSENEIYVSRLKQAGVSVVHNRYKSYHGFYVLNAVGPLPKAPTALKALNDTMNYINKIFQ